MMATDNGVTGPVNIGNPVTFTILHLAETIIRLTKSRSRIVRIPLPEDDPRQRSPDISLAHTMLGWEPVTPLEEGLKPTIAYFKKILGISGAVAPIEQVARELVAWPQ